MTDCWVLLRGLTREKLHWGDFSQKLAAQLNTQVVMIDFPGVGEFFDVESPRSVQEIAASVYEQMQMQGIEKCNVLAHSMGAMVSAALLQAHPEKFEHAVWMNTSFANLSPWYRRLQMKNASKLTRAFIDYGDLYQREKIIYDLTTNIHADASLIDEWVDIQKRHPVSRKTFMNQLWAASQFHFEGGVNHNIVLLGSAHDQFVNNKCTLDIAKHLNIQCNIHEQAGHDLPVDDPQWVIDKIQENLSGF